MALGRDIAVFTRFYIFSLRVRNAQNFKPTNHTVAPFLACLKPSTGFGKTNSFANYTAIFILNKESCCGLLTFKGPDILERNLEAAFLEDSD
ncbi:hypothetical protein CEXT_689041 [Caerostris extrusa]|uniref:Uncharacterized protein n=1 Tax=Caerostris extrusa TaxID=172846 RepID=A0AAV4PGQ2_CAEEX|nr:hypothetical protein CEXT_689041 [Caerostris extrusa]